MKRIDPTVLRRARKAKGWTQDKLAEKTKMGSSPKIDKQTISRLERGRQDETRDRTIEQIARALNLDPAVLTGETSAPERSCESSHLDSKSQLKLRVGTGPNNALSLVASRYRVEPSQIVELAPFLFFWAAEESLRQRRERILTFKRTQDELQDLAKQFCHLRPEITLTTSEEAIGAEIDSIQERDLLGASIRMQSSGFPPDFDSETENPFVLFLRSLIVPFSKIANFVSWEGSLTPQYWVCPDEAAALVGGDRDRAEEILHGFVALDEMPKEIRESKMATERAAWVRRKAEESRERSRKLFAELL